MHLPEGTNTKCGVYRIVNRRNGKFYVGSTKNARVRDKTHFRELKKGVHHCEHLQRAWDQETDKSVFEYQMFIYCKENDRIALEQSCIDHMKPAYNTNLTAGHPPVRIGPANHMYGNGEKSIFFGKPAWNKGLPKEQQPAYGRKASDETKNRLREAHLGQKAWNRGRSLSDEHKKSLREAKNRTPKKRHVIAKLTESDVKEILSSVESLAELSIRYNVEKSTISKILRNVTWKYIPREKIWTEFEIRQRGWTSEKRAQAGLLVRGTRHRDVKLSENDVIEIRSSSARHVDLAKKYGVNPTTIINIRQGATWRHVGIATQSLQAEAKMSLDWPSRDFQRPKTNALSED